MRRKVRILLCSVLFGILMTACVVLYAAPYGENSGADSAFMQNPGFSEPVQTVAWWSLMYERPNPDRLPVEVRFRWLKGLE